MNIKMAKGIVQVNIKGSAGEWSWGKVGDPPDKCRIIAGNNSFQSPNNQLLGVQIEVWMTSITCLVGVEHGVLKSSVILL